MKENPCFINSGASHESQNVSSLRGKLETLQTYIVAEGLRMEESIPLKQTTSIERRNRRTCSNVENCDIYEIIPKCLWVLFPFWALSVTKKETCRK